MFNQFNVIEYATSAMYYIIGKYCPERTGGVLTILRRNGAMLLHMEIGTIPKEKWEKCHRFSLEKAGRLFANNMDVSSWQSRDERLEKYGGAIRTPEYIISFSGLPELCDEALCLLVGCKIDDLTDFIIDTIFGISNNNIGRELIAA